MKTKTNKEGGNTSLNTSKQQKQDEFYTQLSDISDELRHYKTHFAGKTVLCNCDDPYESNFFKFFALVFNDWNIKKLICTCWDGSPIAQQDLVLFEDEVKDEKGRSRIAYKIELTEVRDLNGDGATDLEDVRLLLEENKPQRLDGHGDFRSEECVEFLKEADIVVTNPPFSLFREYIAQLMQYEKKFLIIGNQNGLTYKEVFPLIQDNRLWLGYHSGHTLFAVPDDYEIPDFYDKTDRQRLRSNGYIIDENGKLWRNLGNICWFTNLDHNKRHYPLDLFKHYTPDEYPRYDNYDAINVDKVADIPADYDGIIGVPISFIEKYCPEQFTIFGATESEGKGFSRGLWKESSDVAQPLVRGKRIYKRIFIKKI
ncbi:MAG: adenine-specific methyltransferase EcoRI family protein [Clostridia bacterium]|nr:adenine-specific methyltransferase EcoRI family protein [Clostridia bacterium]